MITAEIVKMEVGDYYLISLFPYIPWHDIAALHQVNEP